MNQKLEDYILIEKLVYQRMIKKKQIQISENSGSFTVYQLLAKWHNEVFLYHTGNFI